MEKIECYIENENKFKFYVMKLLPSVATKGVVFLIHDISDHSGRYEELGEIFCKNGYLFYAPDLRGSGNSKGKRGSFKTIDEALTDVNFLISKVKEEFANTPIFIFSQGMGASIALSLVLNKPDIVKGVVASSPHLKAANSKRGIKRLLAKISTYVAPWWRKSTGITGNMLTHNKILAEQYDNDSKVHGKISLKRAKLLDVSGKIIIANAKLLATPTLLLHSTADPIADFNATFDFFKNSNKNASLYAFNELYHELFNELSQTQITSNVVRWFDDIISYKQL
ncbi:MAG: lysophospholipase [Bacteroidales bacterium]